MLNFCSMNTHRGRGGKALRILLVGWLLLTLAPGKDLPGGGTSSEKNTRFFRDSTVGRPRYRDRVSRKSVSVVYMKQAAGTPFLTPLLFLLWWIKTLSQWLIARGTARPILISSALPRTEKRLLRKWIICRPISRGMQKPSWCYFLPASSQFVCTVAWSLGRKYFYIYKLKAPRCGLNYSQAQTNIVPILCVRTSPCLCFGLQAKVA
jgi:hypothetical protein